MRHVGKRRHSAVQSEVRTAHFLTLMPPSDTNIAPGVERSIYSNAAVAKEDEVTTDANAHRSKGKARASWMTDRKLKTCQIISPEKDTFDANMAKGNNAVLEQPVTRDSCASVERSSVI